MSGAGKHMQGAEREQAEQKWSRGAYARSRQCADRCDGVATCCQDFQRLCWVLLSCLQPTTWSAVHDQGSMSASPSRGPSSLHSLARRFSSCLVSSRPLKRPCRCGLRGRLPLVRGLPPSLSLPSASDLQQSQHFSL